ncbi:MAG: hypothetical protein U0800_15260 [Isosphaeraceae bacterium]
MEPTRELIDDLYRERVLRARRVDPAEKVRDGARLFDMACEIAKAGIRARYPEADEPRVMEILRRRLAIGELLEQSP